MAFPASALSLPSTRATLLGGNNCCLETCNSPNGIIPLPCIGKKKIELFRGHCCQFPSGLYTKNHPTYTKFPSKTPAVARFHDSSRFMTQLNTIKEKTWKVVPDLVKGFRWKKAEELALHQFLLATQEALKWSLLALFVFSSVSDVLYTFSRNQELVIPIGLFVGCNMANFLMEISQELLGISEQRDQIWHLLRIGCVFAFVKIISTGLLVRGRIFLLHAANGGLMQVLWLWKESQQERDEQEKSLLRGASGVEE